MMGLFALSSCALGRSLPPPLLENVKSRAVRTLRTDFLEPQFTGASKRVALEVVEVTLTDRSKERRAFLSFGDGQHHYLGAMQQLRPDEPLEYLMFEIQATRFVIVWVDPAAAREPTFVTLERPEQLTTDDSLNVLRSGEVANRVALIYLPQSEANLWTTLTEARVSAKDQPLDYTWTGEYEPPITIDPYFREITVP